MIFSVKRFSLFGPCIKMPVHDDRNRKTGAQRRNSGPGPAYLRALAMIDERAQDWTSLLQELIQIPSCFESEHEIVRRVSEYVTVIGLVPTLVPMDPVALRRLADAAEPISDVGDRNNVVVRLPGRGGGRSLILNCHLDVQPEGDPAEWTHPPLSGHIDQATRTIFGRGAMDDKAGVTICLGLMRVIVENCLRFNGDLLFQFVLEDEITGNGSLMCLETGHTADAAIILDGTRPDRAIEQHAGNMEFCVEMKGRPASVSVSHMGANAPEMLSRNLLYLRDAFHRLNATREPPWTEFPSPYQFVIHALHADAPRFCVPVAANARCFVTFPPPASIAGVRDFLEHESRRHAQASDYPHLPVFTWQGFAAEPAFCVSEELRALVQKAAERHGIPEVRVGPSTGTSDMRHFSKRGIPCLLYGPGRGFNPHRIDEHFLLDDLPRMMRIYLDMIDEWCNDAPRV
jgi:acetylornithine deacetylase